MSSVSNIGPKLSPGGTLGSEICDSKSFISSDVTANFCSIGNTSGQNFARVNMALEEENKREKKFFYSVTVTVNIQIKEKHIKVIK